MIVGMGWGYCGTDEDGREIGYAIDARCDAPGCNAQINRGLSYCCGDMHGGGEFGCGRYFCADHLTYAGGIVEKKYEWSIPEQLCRGCALRYEEEISKNLDGEWGITELLGCKLLECSLCGENEAVEQKEEEVLCELCLGSQR